MIRKYETPTAPKCNGGNVLFQWAWEDLNFRPHAYQAVDDQPPATETRHFIGLSVSLQLLPTVINRGVCH